ncbi:MAG TPA: CBS domain-containing protein, partial [Mycobacterium sp.]
DALRLMQSGAYRNVPVVSDDGHLVGVVRQVDILKFFAESFPEELLNLPPRPHQRMQQAEGG